MDHKFLAATGLAQADIDAWVGANPPDTRQFANDCERYAGFWRRSAGLLARLPPKPSRNPAEATAAESIKRSARESRHRFLAAHVNAVYAALTDDRARFVRVEQLVYDAATRFPGLTPTRKQVAEESKHVQGDKDGVEIDQGILASHILGDARDGRHLCHAMLLPRAEARALLPKLTAEGAVDLGFASVERRGKAAYVTMKNPRYLNAEDQQTLDPVEICVDLALLDSAADIAVLRGGVVDNPKYAGRRVFGTGINLTHLYYGRVPYSWYLQRELGFVNKFYRGLARPEITPDEVYGDTIEKPWIAVVEAFAIGGHCQYLLTMDYTLASKEAFMTLPARKEGIIPGAANMRLPRFVGDRIARQAIQYERRLDCDSAEGRMICDEIVAAPDMDAALARVVDGLTNSGVVSAAANRRAFRVTQEPFDAFRAYCAVYAREQANCHFSPALIANLERYWNAQSRKI